MATKSTSKSTTAKKTTKTAKSTSTKQTSSRKRTSTKSADRFILKRAKSTSWMAIFESLVIGALGILLLIAPEGMTKVIFYVVGIFLMIKGVYKIINYFAVHGKYDFYNNDLLYGSIAVVLWQQLGQFIGIVVGAWMIYGALVRMNTAIKMHSAGIKEWFYVLLLSMIMLALGIYMVISVGAVLAIVGWVMVISAIVGIVDDLVFIRHIDAVSE